MDSHKIENFKRFYGEGVEFPDWRSLTELESRRLHKRIRVRMQLPAGEDFVSEKELFDRSVCLGDVTNAESLDVSGILADRGVVCSERVFLNWLQWDIENFDEIAVGDLSRFFDDIWYPSADDLLIFDESVDWMMTVFHEGDLLLWRF